MRNQAEVTLYVSGIFCTYCSAFLQEVLSDLKGVFGVSIDLIKEIICVVYNPDTVAVSEFTNIITVHGYEVNDKDILTSYAI
jgi:copper chaperone CopZ